MLGNMVTGKGIMRAGKCVVRAAKQHNDMNHMCKIF